MASTIGLISYNDTSRQEDVVDLITNVDYTSTPFLSRIGESAAANTFHWVWKKTICGIKRSYMLEHSPTL